MDLNLPEKRVFLGPANLWKRLLAFILDIFILDFFVMGFFKSVTGSMLGNAADVMAAYRLMQQDTAQVNALTIMFVLIIMLALAYFVLTQYIAGQTLGCMLVNIHVVAQKSEKEFTVPGFWQCVVRNIFIIPTIPFILFWIADPVYFFFARRGQRLSEWLSTTRVIERYEI